MSLEDCFLLIWEIQVLFEGLEHPSQSQLFVSLNRNPVRRIIKYPPLSPTEIKNYPDYENYFLYQPIKDDDRIYYIRKNDLFKVKKNLRALVINEWMIYPWKLN
ncbi:hypothetical protein ACKGJO_05250 [Gracilimonas sp. Q87]|uniref:hypothetical protein n=1 Tax=Gracilimonas sp. Q87 TaxID=3384766 RepID=UPI003984144D